METEETLAGPSLESFSLEDTTFSVSADLARQLPSLRRLRLHRVAGPIDWNIFPLPNLTSLSVVSLAPIMSISELLRLLAGMNALVDLDLRMGYKAVPASRTTTAIELPHLLTLKVGNATFTHTITLLNALSMPSLRYLYAAPFHNQRVDTESIIDTMASAFATALQNGNFGILNELTMMGPSSGPGGTLNHFRISNEQQYYLEVEVQPAQSSETTSSLLVFVIAATHKKSVSLTRLDIATLIDERYLDDLVFIFAALPRTETMKLIGGEDSYGVMASLKEEVEFPNGPMILLPKLQSIIYCSPTTTSWNPDDMIKELPFLQFVLSMRQETGRGLKKLYFYRCEAYPDAIELQHPHTTVAGFAAIGVEVGALKDAESMDSVWRGESPLGSVEGGDSTTTT